MHRVQCLHLLFGRVVGLLAHGRTSLRLEQRRGPSPEQHQHNALAE